MLPLEYFMGLSVLGGGWGKKKHRENIGKEATR